MHPNAVIKVDMMVVGGSVALRIGEEVCMPLPLSTDPTWQACE
jgi:hypothetical protein